LLVNHFVKKIGKAIGKTTTRIPGTVLEELAAYDWPGNVRELEYVIERAIITSTSTRLRLMESLTTAAIEDRHEGLQSHAEMERKHILQVLEQTRWVVEGPKGAARILELHPNTLRYRMKKHGIRRPD